MEVSGAVAPITAWKSKKKVMCASGPGATWVHQACMASAWPTRSQTRHTATSALSRVRLERAGAQSGAARPLRKWR